MADIGEFVGKIKYSHDPRGLDEALTGMEKVGKETSLTDKILSKFVFTFGDLVNVARKVGAIFVDLITEYGKQELALTQLSNAMKLQGIYTEEAYKENVKYAESLAQTTKYADEEIEAIMTLLTSFGLHDEQLRKTTMAVLDYNALTGRGTTEIANALGKAFQGNTTMLSRLQIKFDETKSSAGQYSEILGIMASRSKGFAEEEGKSTLGTLTNLSKGFKELQETLGGILIPLFDRFAVALQNDFKWINNSLKGIKGFIDYFTGAKEEQVSVEEMTTGAILNAVEKRSQGEIDAEEEKQRKLKTINAREYVAKLELERKKRNITIDTQIQELLAIEAKLNKESELYKIYSQARISLELAKAQEIEAIETNMVGIIAENINSLQDMFVAFKNFVVQEVIRIIAKELVEAIGLAEALRVALIAVKTFTGGIFSFLGFQEGGVVPGLRGAPKLVVAHGGETILPTHKESPNLGKFGLGGDTYNFDIKMNGGDRKQAEFVADTIYRKIKRNKRI